jgi:hypothetical protein
MDELDTAWDSDSPALPPLPETHPAEDPSQQTGSTAAPHAVPDPADAPTLTPEPSAELGGPLTGATVPARANGFCLDLDDPPRDESALGLADRHTPENLVEPRRTVPSAVRPARPPALADTDRPPAPGPGDPAAAKDMKDRHTAGDYSGALHVAEQILALAPGDEEARRYAQGCRDVLIQMYASRLGSLDSIARVIVAPEQIRWLSLDHRAGFLLSLVDGTSSVEDLLDICGMPRLDALRILIALVEQRVISLG